MDVDWDAWTPADRAAAEAIAGPRLQELLDAASIELPFAKSRTGELSAILQAALTSDVTTREMGGPVPVTNSVQSLARQLETLVDNAADAAPLAHPDGTCPVGGSHRRIPQIRCPARRVELGARRQSVRRMPGKRCGRSGADRRAVPVRDGDAASLRWMPVRAARRLVTDNTRAIRLLGGRRKGREHHRAVLL
jgi:hypothetical protein